MGQETAPSAAPARLSHEEAALENERTRRHLAQAGADLDDFAHIVSHDLKAPLRALGHLVEWITEDVQETAGPETHENLKLMKTRVARLQTLLDGLLTYARAGHERNPVEDVDMDELVGDIAALLSPPPGFSIVCTTPLGILRTQRHTIRTVLTNLMSNALHYHDRHEGVVSVSMTRTGPTVTFRVADDGPGIAPRQHQRIFAMFQTLSSRNETKGVGLAIVKKLVERHGGRIDVQSEPPARGTAFVFTWQEAKQAVLF